MSSLLSAIGGNPFSSQVGQRIEHATDPSLSAEDWTLILEVCDLINGTDEGPKDAIKAIRKRLSNHKSYKSILYTLTLLEAVVKNCGARMHKQVATKDFLHELTKLVGQKGQPSNSPQIVKEKVLSLLQSWADAFRNASELQQIQITYNSLREQGYQFPDQDLDTMSPIFLKNKNNTATTAVPQTAVVQPNGTRSRTYAPPGNQPVGSPTRAGSQRQPKATGPINPSPEQLSKLRSELDIVEGNVRVLSEMLTELQPGQEEPNDYKLLVELDKTCREMQKRVIALLERIANEEVTGVLLRINDDLNNVFIRYDRYDRNRKAVTGEVKPEEVNTTPASQPNGSETPTVDPSLITFEETESTRPSAEDEEFDMFAQSRSSTFADSRNFGSTYDDNREGVPQESFAGVLSARNPYPPLPEGERPQHKTVEEDAEDIGEWLKGTDLSKLEEDERIAREAAMQAAKPRYTVQTSEDVKTLSSSEFDKFLSERAAAGPQRTPSASNTQSRQMKNFIAEKESDEMFDL